MFNDDMFSLQIHYTPVYKKKHTFVFDISRLINVSHLKIYVIESIPMFVCVVFVRLFLFFWERVLFSYIHLYCLFIHDDT